MKYLILITVILFSCNEDKGLKEAERIIKESKQRYSADSLAIERQTQIKIEQAKAGIKQR